MKRNLLFVLFLLLASFIHAQTITTIAGTSVQGYTGDNGPATAAQLYKPFDLVLDAAGNIYFSDTYNNVIRKIDATTGIITTIAGNNGYGFGGDGGPATAAILANPNGVTLDAAGDLYFADANNNRVRKLTFSTGIITTVAGSGSGTFKGDGGPAVKAGIDLPTGVIFDSQGNLLISDQWNDRIRKVDMTTGIITSIAGNGVGSPGGGAFSGDGGQATVASIYRPYYFALDTGRNVCFADQFNSRIRKIDRTTGIITTIAGNGNPVFSGDGGPATNAGLNVAISIAIDPSGNMFIADHHNFRIRKVDAATGIINTIAGKGTAGYSGDGGPADSAQLNNPLGIALDRFGNVYFADANNNCIRKITFTANAITTGNIPGPFCACDTILVPFTSFGTYNPGNLYTAQLSDATGSFANPVSIAVIQSVANSGTFPAVIPCNTIPGTKYRIRVVSSNPAVIGTDNGVDISISMPSAASVTIAAAPSTNICAGVPVTFTATPVNGGTAPMYQWKLNGSNVGTNTVSYTNTSLANGDVVSCTMTSSAKCVSGSPAASNSDTISVTSITPGIITTPQDSVCSGAIVHFVLSGNSGGSIQWQSSTSNGNFTNIPGATKTTYATPPITKTTYYRVFVSGGTCDSASSVFKVQALPAPVASFVVTGINGHDVSFDGSASSGAIYYSWDFGDGKSSTSISPVHTYDSTGLYHVCLSVKNNSNCDYTICKNVTTYATAINVVTPLEVYPNPFNGQLYISTGDQAGLIDRIEMYDLLGRNVLTQKINGSTANPIRIDLNSIATSVYFVQIVTQQGTITRKVVKE